MGATALFHDVQPIALTTYAGPLTRNSSGNLHVRKDNLAATTAPGVGDDSADGYEVGSVWIDVTGGNVYTCKSAGVGAASWLTSVQSPGGSDTYIQYNSSGAFGGSADLTWNDSTKALGVNGKLTVNPASGVPLIVQVNGANALTVDATKNTVCYGLLDVQGQLTVKYSPNPALVVDAGTGSSSAMLYLVGRDGGTQYSSYVVGSSTGNLTLQGYGTASIGVNNGDVAVSFASDKNATFSGSVSISQ